MIRVLRLIFFFAACAAFSEGWVPVAHAEEFPSRTIKIIVGQGAGTTSDTIARIVGAKLGALLEQSVVIEGHSGAAGTIAAAMVAKAPPDGYMLLLASSSNLALATVTGETLSYDPVKDFAPIGRIARIPWALGISTKLPVKTIPELIAYGKAHPGRLTGSSTGPGSAASFGLDTLSQEAGINILNVSYRTVVSALQGVVSGEVDMMFTDVSMLAPHVKNGTLRLLAAAGDRRLREYPDLPTMAEQGVAGIAIEPWYGLAAPAGTPRDVIAKLSDALRRALRAPDVRGPLLELGYEIIEETPGEFAAAISADIARFAVTARNQQTKATR